MWEFPGGKIEKGESHKEALVREIKEELLCEIVPYELLSTITFQYPTFHLTMHVYISKITNGNPILTEHSALRWVNAHEVDCVEWVPADIDIIPKLKNYLINLQ